MWILVCFNLRVYLFIIPKILIDSKLIISLLFDRCRIPKNPFFILCININVAFKFVYHIFNTYLHFHFKSKLLKRPKDFLKSNIRQN